MNFWETITRGEYVMFALAVLFILVIIIWIVRATKLSSLINKNLSMMHRIRDYVVEGDLDNAIEFCQANPSPGARIICAGLTRVGQNMAEISTVMLTAREAESSNLEKGKRWINAIAIMAPLIGAAGTLAGICDGLIELADAGAFADMALLGQEIAPTIVTTIVGLGVGVFSIFAYYCLEGAIDKTKSSLASLALEFEDLLNEPS